MAVLQNAGKRGDMAAENREIAVQYARLALCERLTACGECVSCVCWKDGDHPDMVLAGKWDKPPGIEECLEFQAALQLRPFAAPGRLGVAVGIDSMSLPAANSLLKIAEEPPENVRLLFLSESEDIIPTLKSRMWTLRCGGIGKEEVHPSPPPGSPAEWASWLERTKKFSLDDMILDICGWIEWFEGRSDWRTAAALQNISNIAAERRIPVSMVQDVFYAFLKEGIRVEQIFGNVRQT